MKILFTGGGTGGHIFPIIAVVREIKRIQFQAAEGSRLKRTKFEFLYLGPKDAYADLFLPEEGITASSILAGKMRRYFTPLSSIQNFIDIFFKTPIGTIQAFFKILFLSPDLIFSRGGYGSLPVVLAGRLWGVPIFLHESDVVPSLANKISSRFSHLIFTSFQKTEYFPQSKTVWVGNPVRREILEGTKEGAKNIFSLKGDRPLIFVVGGSQGAQRINDVILNSLERLLEIFEIIHQCGENNYQEVRDEADVILKEETREYYHLYPFLREGDLKYAYKVCDLAISRAGAGTIAEISAVGRPSIMVPLPESAQNHQFKNAQAYATEGAAIVIEEVSLTTHFLVNRLKYLFSNPGELEKMEEGAKRFARPEAAETVARHILEYLLT